MRKFIVAALLIGTAATPALAQDAPVNAAGTGPRIAGPRIEGLIGYDAPKDSSNGLLYGVGVGYDFTVGGATAGVEAEYTDTDSDNCEEDVFVAGDELCAGLGRDLYVGGRVGAAFGSSSFVYAKAGYTNQRIRAEYDNGGSTLTSDAEEGDNLDGFRVGAGIEFGIPTFGFGSSAYLKGEYRYSNYEQGLEKHQGLAGIGFRF